MKALALLLLLSTTACSTMGPDTRPGISTISSMGIDCRNKVIEINYLEGIIDVSDSIGIDKDDKASRITYMRYNAAVRNLIWKIRSTC